MGILGELWVKLGLKNEGLKKGLNDSKKEVSGFASSMKKLGGIIGAAFSVKAIVDFTHQTAELANKASGVKKAFDRLNSPGLLTDLRRATMGTVDDLQLMQRAVQANNFKIPLNQLATYLEFATKRASETGESVDYLVDSIITGLGRQSVMILDNLGISAAEIRDRMKEGGTMADAVGKIIKEQMGEGVTEIDKATLATERLTAAWTNFQLAFGGVTSGAWNWIKGQLAGVLEETTGILNSNNLNKWQKFFALNPFTGGIMRMAGTIDRALAKDAEESELIGPMPNPNLNTTTQVEQETEATRKLVEQINKEIVAKEKLAEILDDKPNQLFNAENIKAQSAVAMEAIEAHYQKYIDALEDARKKAMEQQQMLDEMNEHFNNSIVAGISGGIQELARAVAGVDGANIGTVAQALLTPMADALASAGEMIIAEGIAVEAFKDSLKSLNGPVAIAAGAALVAVAGAVKAGLQAIGNNPTSASGYASSVTSYSGGYGVNTANYSQSANDYTLVTTLKGQDLLLSIERTQQSKRR